MTSKVLKFGGTSLATPERIERAVSLTARTRTQMPVIVVVSAFGGVTNALNDALASSSCELAKARIAEVAERYLRSARALSLEHSVQLAIAGRRDELFALLDGLSSPKELSPLKVDRVLATGEAFSAIVFERALAERGLPSRLLAAEEIILTNDEFGAAQVDLGATTLAIRSLGLEFFRRNVVVIAGFTGATESGATTTLGRNASDYSAAIVAAALRANLDIYTDVAGIYSADPKRVASARVLPQLTYLEAQTLAEGGAKVIHAATLKPLLGSQCTIRVLDSFQPEAPGTCLTEHPTDPNHAVCAVALQRGPAYAVLTLVQNPLTLQAPAQAEQALRAVGVSPIKLTYAGIALTVQVSASAADRAVAALHDRFVLGLKRVNVAVVGATGRVGRALVERLDRVARNAQDELGLDLKLVAVANSRSGAFDIEGIDASAIALSLQAPSAFRIEDFWAELKRRHLASLVIVDVTASAAVAARYQSILKDGAAVVTANKLAPSGDSRVFRELKALSRGGPPFLFETTVGAGLPVLKTLNELKSAGENLTALEAVLSGTLNFVCDALNRGEGLTDSVLQAALLGLTEPDPLLDLSGEDVARKLVILLRGAGIEIDRPAIEVEPLLPAPAQGATLNEHLRLHESRMVERAASARGNGKRLVYRAEYENGRARVALTEVDADDPIGRLNGPENLIRVYTPSYQRQPLTIRGPGAGVEVTAAGVLADILAAAALIDAAGVAMRRAASLPHAHADSYPLATALAGS